MAIAFSSLALTYIALFVWLSNLMFLDGNGLSFLFNKVDRPMLRNPRQSWILESTPRIPDIRHWIPVFVSGTWILDSKCDLVRFRILERCILDSEAQNCRFHKQKFPGFHKPDSLLT